MLKLGSTDINKAYLGATEINKIYLGADEVFSGGVAPFDPSQIPDLALWLDASDTSTIVQSGGAVSQWGDKSGNGYNATNIVGAEQPISGTRQINGLNAIDFDGVNDQIHLPSGVYTIPNENNSVFLVCAFDVFSAAPQRLLQGAITGSTRWSIRLNNEAQFICTNDTSLTNTIIGTVSNTDQHVIGFVKNGTSITGFLDGVGGSTGAANNVTVNDARIGFQGVTDPFNGRMGEIVVYRRALSTSERGSVINYLKNKWGTP